MHLNVISNEGSSKVSCFTSLKFYKREKMILILTACRAVSKTKKAKCITHTTCVFCREKKMLYDDLNPGKARWIKTRLTSFQNPSELIHCNGRTILAQDTTQSN